MRALALEHWRSDAFSVFGELLAERQVSVDRVLVSDVDHLPDWQEYDLIIAMGGPMGVYEEVEYPWLLGEKQTIREAVTAGTPFFGVCFGAQLLASSLGAEVYRGPAPELGLNPIFLSEAARRDPVFRGFPRDLEVFEWHQDAFDLPQGALCLARSPRYANQAMRVGRVAYGIQCHFEKSAEDVGRSLEAKPELLGDLEKRYGKGSVERFLEVYAALVPSLQETARQILRRWLELSGAVGGAAPARARAPVEPPSEALIARGEEQKRIEDIFEEVTHGWKPCARDPRRSRSRQDLPARLGSRACGRTAGAVDRRGRRRFGASLRSAGGTLSATSWPRRSTSTGAGPSTRRGARTPRDDRARGSIRGLLRGLRPARRSGSDFAHSRRGRRRSLGGRGERGGACIRGSAWCTSADRSSVCRGRRVFRYRGSN